MIISGIKALGSITLGSGGTLAALVGGFGPFAAILLGIGAAIVGVNAAIDKYNKELRKNEIAAERAKNAADELAESAKKVASEFEALNNLANEYDDLVEIFKAADEGTQEWYDSLYNVNKKINEIIQAYPELLNIEGIFTPNGEIDQAVLD
jgi:chromosome segregation ATPase